MLDTDNYIRYTQVDAVHRDRDRGGGRAAPGAAADRRGPRGRGPGQDQPRRGVRREPDLRGVRGPAGRRAGLHRGARRGRGCGSATAACTVSLWLDPFRIDVHRADGTPVVETAADEEGRYWAYATLNDAFTLRRRCRQEDAIFGLGEKAGRHNRKGRDFTLWNTDVLSPSETREFTDGQGAGRPARRPALGRVRPLLRQHPVLLPPGLPGRADGRVVPGQRLPRQLRVLASRGVPDPLPWRPVHRVRLRRARHAGHPDRVHRADRPDRATAALVARLPPVPLVRLHPGRGRADRRRAPGVRRALRLAVAGHRVHGRLPGVHLGRRAVPRPAGDAGAAWPSRASG